MPRDYRTQIFQDCLQTFGKLCIRSAHYTAGDIYELLPFALYHPVAGHSQARVDAQNADADGETFVRPWTRLGKNMSARQGGLLLDHRGGIHVLHIIQGLQRVQESLHTRRIIARQRVFGSGFHGDLR